MVKAGVYLIARFILVIGPLAVLLPYWLPTVAWIGVLTAIIGATLAFNTNDIKGVLAYSTISQLGFMMAALGTAASASAAMWSYLEDQGIAGIKGVWCHELGFGNLFNVVSIEQLYAGHSRQVGLIASQYIKYTGRYTVVVEEDVDHVVNVLPGIVKRLRMMSPLTPKSFLEG
jgi:NADH:ubiquinone oxidoreductase subunit 4 (subunit M)